MTNTKDPIQDNNKKIINKHTMILDIRKKIELIEIRRQKIKDLYEKEDRDQEYELLSKNKPELIKQKNKIQNVETRNTNNDNLMNSQQQKHSNYVSIYVYI